MSRRNVYIYIYITNRVNLYFYHADCGYSVNATMKMIKLLLVYKCIIIPV